MEKYINAKKNLKYIFFEKQKTILSMWKLTLGCSICFGTVQSLIFWGMMGPSKMPITRRQKLNFGVPTTNGNESQYYRHIPTSMFHASYQPKISLGHNTRTRLSAFKSRCQTNNTGTYKS
jgi:hypothetical protein